MHQICTLRDILIDEFHLFRRGFGILTLSLMVYIHCIFFKLFLVKVSVNATENFAVLFLIICRKRQFEIKEILEKNKIKLFVQDLIKHFNTTNFI